MPWIGKGAPPCSAKCKRAGRRSRPRPRPSTVAAAATMQRFPERSVCWQARRSFPRPAGRRSPAKSNAGALRSRAVRVLSQGASALSLAGSLASEDAGPLPRGLDRATRPRRPAGARTQRGRRRCVVVGAAGWKAKTATPLTAAVSFLRGVGRRLTARRPASMAAARATATPGTAQNCTAFGGTRGLCRTQKVPPQSPHRAERRCSGFVPPWGGVVAPDRKGRGKNSDAAGRKREGRFGRRAGRERSG